MPGPDGINTNLTTQQPLSRLPQPQAEVPKEKQIDIAKEMQNTAARAAEQQPPQEVAPEEGNKKVQFTGSIGVGAREISNVNGQSNTIFDSARASSTFHLDGVSLEGGVKFPSGTFVNGTLQTGIELASEGAKTRYSRYAALEVGQEFDIGKNMGLELSAKAQYAHESAGRGQFDYAQDDLRTSAGAALTYQNDKGLKVTAGVEGGIIDNPGVEQVEMTAKLAPNSNQIVIAGGSGSEIGDFRDGKVPEGYRDMSDYIFEKEQNEVSVIQTKKASSKTYFTPKVTVEQQLGKSNFTLTGSASLNEVNAGVRYRFGGGKK